MTSKSCCDKAIDEGTLIRKGRACWVCPTCGKDQMLKLVFMHDAGLEYIPGKGLKTAIRKQPMTSKLKCPIKAYEATLTIDGKWKMTLTAPNIAMAIDGLRADLYDTAKNIEIKVKEI